MPLYCLKAILLGNISSGFPTLCSCGCHSPGPPVFAAGTVSDEGLWEDGHSLPLGKAGALVPWEFKLHGRVE